MKIFKCDKCLIIFYQLDQRLKLFVLTLKFLSIFLLIFDYVTICEDKFICQFLGATFSIWFMSKNYSFQILTLYWIN